MWVEEVIGEIVIVIVLFVEKFGIESKMVKKMILFLYEF